MYDVKKLISNKWPSYTLYSLRITCFIYKIFLNETLWKSQFVIKLNDRESGYYTNCVNTLMLSITFIGRNVTIIGEITKETRMRKFLRVFLVSVYYFGLEKNNWFLIWDDMTDINKLCPLPVYHNSICMLWETLNSIF